MKMSDDMTKKNLAWLARQSQPMRQEVFRAAMRIRRQRLSYFRGTPNADVRNSPKIEEQALLSAILELRNPRLKSSDPLDATATSRALAAKSANQRKSPKKDRLQILMPQILKLRNSGMSYAEIARVLTTQTRKKISRSYVHAICKEVGRPSQACSGDT